MHTWRNRLDNLGHLSFKISKELQLLNNITREKKCEDWAVLWIKRTNQNSRKSYLRLRKHKLTQAMSTSLKLEDRERFSDDKWKHRATWGITTFLMLGQPTQLRFCSKRLGCSTGKGMAWSWEYKSTEQPMLGSSGSWSLLQPQFRSCIFAYPFKLTWVRRVQQARSSSMADWQRVPYDNSNSQRAGRAPSL